MNKNLAASVRARLLNIAKAQGVDFNQVLIRFSLERILFRMSQSAHADRFLLKGALLFTLWYDMPHGKNVTRTTGAAIVTRIPNMRITIGIVNDTSHRMARSPYLQRWTRRHCHPASTGSRTPNYVERNRALQQERNAKAVLRPIAKMDASDPVKHCRAFLLGTSVVGA